MFLMTRLSLLLKFEKSRPQVTRWSRPGMILALGARGPGRAFFFNVCQGYPFRCFQYTKG